MTVSPETLLAFIEGELSFDEARRVAAEVANDPALADYVEKHRALKARLQAVSRPPETFAPHSQASAMATAVQMPADAKPLPPAAAVWQVGKSWVPAAAMAVGIGLGLLLAGTFNPATNIRAAGGVAVADGDLARILSTQLALEQDEAAPAAAHIRESFFSKEGYFCRSFLTGGAADGGLAGIACRQDNAWRIAALAATQPSDTKTAAKDAKPSAELPASVKGALSAMMVGDPLDADGERTARGQNWIAH